MTDAAFLAAFEDGTLTEDFNHRSHLRMAWRVLSEDGRQRGTERILTGIQRFAKSKGADTKFHVTMTLYWIHEVDRALRETPDAESFDAFLARHPELGTAGSVFEHYSKERILSDAARGAWVEPDLKPLS